MGVGLDTRRLRLDLNFKRTAAWHSGFDFMRILSMGVDMDTRRLRLDADFKRAAAAYAGFDLILDFEQGRRLGHAQAST